jgi:hypothetical protein
MAARLKNKDADLLLIGAIPQALKDDTKINLLVEATKSWVKMPMRHYDLASIYPDDEARTPNTRTDITSSGPMAAIIGFQSPYNDQRSVVALLADSPRGNELLTNALNDSGKRAAMFGSVAVIRESGVNSLRVAISTTWVICRGSSASGLRSLTTRCCWRSGCGQHCAAGMGAVAHAAHHQPSPS